MKKVKKLAKVTVPKTYVLHPETLKLLAKINKRGFLNSLIS